MCHSSDNQYGALIGAAPPCPFVWLLGTIKLCIKLEWITNLSKNIISTFVTETLQKVEKWFCNCMWQMDGKRFYDCKQILWIMNHKNNKLARVRALLWLKFNKNNLNVCRNTFSCMDIRRQHSSYLPGDRLGHFQVF